MKYQMRFAAQVLSQLIAASDYYELQSDGLGAEFEREIQSLLDRIGENPRIYQTRFSHVHCALCLRFNYHVYYCIEDDRVTILEFRDARREPPQYP